MIRFVRIDGLHELLLSLSLAVCILCVTTTPTSAHVNLDSPNGGESLTGGSNFLIEWRPQVAMHDTQNFDVWYSVASNTGPWTIIALDQPPGDLAVGSLHTHSWLVPSINDASAWIRIRQDNNVDADYEDVSDGSFSIATVIGLAGDYNGNGVVDAADYVVWHKNNGTQQQFVEWRYNFGNSLSTGSAQVRTALSRNRHPPYCLC